jgi:Fe-S-cluster containining protein
MECPENCGRCCGPVFVPRATWERFRDRAAPCHWASRVITALLGLAGRKVVLPFAPTMKCAFLDERARCRIYPDRPRVCRLFGEIPRLPCQVRAGSRGPPPGP